MAEDQGRSKFIIVDGYKVLLSNLCEQKESKQVVLQLHFYELKKAGEASNKFNKLEQQNIIKYNDLLICLKTVKCIKILTELILFILSKWSEFLQKYQTTTVLLSMTTNIINCVLSMATNIINFKCLQARHRGKNFQGICCNQFK